MAGAPPDPGTGPPPYRVLLGRDRTGWVAAPPQVGALVLGPPRSGKTTSVVVPNAMAWPGPLLVTSTRREVLDACAAVRSRRGAVACFDPLGAVHDLPPTVRRLHWSPLRGCRRWDTAIARARALTAGAGRGVEHADHWHARAAQLLAALLHAAAVAGRPMSAVVGWVHRHEHAVALGVLGPGAAPQPVAPVPVDGSLGQAAQVLEGIDRTPERERASVWSTVAGVLSAFDTAAVLRSADAAADRSFDPAELLEGAHSIFVVAPSDAGTDLAPLVVGLVEEVRSEAVRRTDRSGPLRYPLLLALDELANICPLPSLPQIAAEGGGRNVILLMALQDLSQAAARWGGRTAEGLLTLAGAKLALPGLADVQTLRRLEALGGQREVAQRSATVAPTGRLFPFTTTSQHVGPVERPRFPAAQIRQLPPGRGLAIVGARPAMLVALTHYRQLEPFAGWSRLAVAPVPPGARSPFDRPGEKDVLRPEPVRADPAELGGPDLGSR